MQTRAQQLGCRGTGWASPAMAGPDVSGLEHAQGWFRFWEGRGGHPEVGVPLAGAHICTDVLCAHSCLQPRHRGAPAQSAVPVLSLLSPACPGCWGHRATSSQDHI